MFNAPLPATPFPSHVETTLRNNIRELADAQPNQSTSGVHTNNTARPVLLDNQGRAPVTRPLDQADGSTRPLPSTASLVPRLPTADQVTPEDLRDATRPVKRLRKDKSSATAAKELLQEIGYVAANKGKLSSDRGAPEAAWPEDYIDRLDGSEPTYESLSQSEFVAGYLSIMEEDTPVCPQTDRLIRHIHYLRGLMEDCFEVDWNIVRMAHKQVLNAIEHGRLRWEDTRACLDIKTTALHRVLRIPAQTSQKAIVREQPVNPCPLFQSLTCQLPGEHTTDGILYAHCCSYCHRTTGRKNSHAETNCNKKQEADAKRSKNARRRRRQHHD